MRYYNGRVEYSLEEVEAYIKIRKEGFASAFFARTTQVIENITKNSNVFIAGMLSRYFEKVQNLPGTMIPAEEIQVSKIDAYGESKDLYILLVFFPNITAYDNRHEKIKDSQKGTAYLYCQQDKNFYSFFFVEPLHDAINNRDYWIYYKLINNGQGQTPTVETLGNYSNDDFNHQFNTFTEIHNADYKKTIVAPVVYDNEIPANASTYRDDGSFAYFSKKDEAMNEIETSYIPALFFKYEEDFVKDLINKGSAKVAEIFNGLLETFGFDGNFANRSFKVTVGPKTEGFSYVTTTFPPHIYNSPDTGKAVIEHVSRLLFYYNETFTIFRCYSVEPFFLQNTAQRGATIYEITRRGSHDAIGPLVSTSLEDITALLFAKFRAELDSGND